METGQFEINETKTIAKNFFTQIDFDALYGSSMWFGIIHSCMEVYTKESLYFGSFGADVASNLKRIKNQQVYEDLIDAAISVTEKFSLTNDQEAFVDFIITAQQLELKQSVANHQLLYMMATQNGGRMVFPDQIGSIPSLIKANETVKTIAYEDRSYEELINLKFIFFLLLLLLSGEWFMRKRDGEI
jgi:hypothetical protein